eukprot:Sspe_Gene.97280::Locus_70904_Transcript_1_1_Confidence_1.000_Length_854::g.97280::m.97280
MSRPPSMGLPDLRELIARVLDSRAVVLADARSFFYQFPVSPEVAKYFGFHAAGPRGRFERFRLRAMCMGWSWAPAIAQRAASTLLGPQDGAAWVDNFLVLGSSVEDAQEKADAFRERCRRANVELDIPSEAPTPEPLTRFTALGLEFDLTQEGKQRVRMDPDWVAKVADSDAWQRVDGGRAAARDFYKVLGAVVWHGYATGRRLCSARATLSFLSAWAESRAFLCLSVVCCTFPLLLL